jgi:hypothetical protein
VEGFFQFALDLFHTSSTVQMVGHYIHSCYNTWFFHFIVEESSNSGCGCPHTPSNGSPLTSDAWCSWEFWGLLPFHLKLSLWTFKIDQQLEFLEPNLLCGCPLKPCSPVISCQVVRCINLLVSAQINHWQIHELFVYNTEVLQVVHEFHFMTTGACCN